MNKTRVLVTGATGHLGSLIIEYILEHRLDVIITATSRDEALAKTKTWYHLVQYIPADLFRIDTDLYTFFKKPDLLIHTAWGDLDNYKSPKHVEEYLPNHYRFLEAIVTGGLRDMTILGTCFEYGVQEGILREDMLAQPVLPYAIAKYTLSEQLKELCAKNHDVNYKWLRIFYIQTKGEQKRKTLFSELDKAIVRGDVTFPMSGGEQLRDYLPIDRMIEQIVCAAFRNDITGIINCCSGKAVSIRSLVEQYIAERGSSIQPQYGAFPYPAHEAMAFWGDAEKIHQILRKAQ